MSVSNKDYTMKDGIVKDKRSLPKLLSIYNNNLRIRMDLMADIVTNVPNSENSRWLFKDVINRFIDNRILADTISGVSDFTYVFECKDEDIRVAIPNDSIGMDAFSIILENIIRNCAKHGGKNDIKLSFHIQNGALPQIKLPDYYKITIHQDCSKYPEGCEICKIIKDRRIDINKPILDEKTQALRIGAWGILEMKIASAYLRKIPPEEIDEKLYRLEIIENEKDNPDNGNWINGYRNSSSQYPYIPYLLNADCCKDSSCESNKGLGYSFFLKKPEEVMIFDFDNKIIIIDDRLKILRNHGIEIINGTNKIEQLIKNQTYNHKILLCFSFNKKENIQIFNIREESINGERILIDYTSRLPSRIIWIKEKEIQSSLIALLNKEKDEGIKDFIRECWKIWSDEIIKQLHSDGFNYFRMQGKLHPKINIGKCFDICLPTRPHSLNILNDGNRFQYFDIDTSFSLSKLPFKNSNELQTLFNNRENIYKYEIISLFESFINKVGILDERIQEFAYNSKYKIITANEEVPYIHCFYKMNIFIPNKYESTEKSSFDNEIDLGSTEYNKVKERILRWINIEGPKLNFLFVHMGILEKLCGDTNKQKVNDYFIDNFINKCGKCKIIIISGRGKPHNIPKNSRFLNYSQVAAYLCDNQSKYLLNDLCYSARKIK